MQKNLIPCQKSTSTIIQQKEAAIPPTAEAVGFLAEILMKKVTLMLAAVALLCGGCVTNPLYKPSKGLVNTVIPEYEKYVKEDPNLTPLEKNVRLMNAKSYRRLIEEYEGQKK